MNTSTPLDVFIDWYNSLKQIKANGGPSIGTMSACLVLLDRLQKEYNLDIQSHIAKGGAQIKGASGKAVAAILKRYKEERPFAKEGGRTNRGVLQDLKPMLDSLGPLKLSELTEPIRNQMLQSFQEFLVGRVADYHNRQKIKLTFDSRQSTWQIIHKLIKDAQLENKGGPVAQHLVGAKLQLRFPEMEISNEGASTADAPTNRSGDFTINNTVFHITVAPMPPVYEKCNQNIEQGLKAFLLVPDAKLAAAREMGQQICGGLVAVESLESFLSQNIEEISKFSQAELKRNLISLFELYNARVTSVEVNLSLLIELPSNLK